MKQIEISITTFAQIPEDISAGDLDVIHLTYKLLADGRLLDIIPGTFTTDAIRVHLKKGTVL